MSSSKKLFYPVLLISLLISNGLTLFNADAYDALYAAFARYVPLSWKRNSPSTQLSSKSKTIKHIKAKTKMVSHRIHKRALRNISANLAAIPAESIPVIGIGVVIAITAMDLHDTCEDLKDIDELTMLSGIKNPDSNTIKVCGFKLPNASSSP